MTEVRRHPMTGEGRHVILIDNGKVKIETNLETILAQAKGVVRDSRDTTKSGLALALVAVTEELITHREKERVS